MTVSEQIIQVLDNLGEKFGLAIDWSSENILPYANELMNKAVSYELWMNIIPLALVTITVIISWVVFCKTIKKKNFSWYDTNGLLWIGIISLSFGIAFSIVFIVVLLINIPTIITCLTFPEKVIFDMIKLML